jgi:hypothetical protein
VIVPYLRGYGTTRFRDHETFRNGQPSLAEAAVITVPAITLEGDANGAAHPRPELLRRQVLGQVFAPHDRGRRRHNLPQEASEAFADAVIEVDSH